LLKLIKKQTIKLQNLNKNMVATFPITPTTPARNLSPEINTTVNTFLGLNPTSINNPNAGSTKTCNVTINVSNLARDNAISAFERIFSYVQVLAKNDLNPVASINQNTVSPADPGNVFSPTGICNVSVDMSEIVATVKLSLQVSNLRLDYMDEYFAATLSYLSLAIANDLNPDTP
jgi:hypothetical protein